MKMGTLTKTLNKLCTSEGAERSILLDKCQEVCRVWIETILQPVLNRLAHRDDRGQLVEYQACYHGGDVVITTTEDGKIAEDQIEYSLAFGGTVDFSTELWEHLYNLLIEK